MDNPITNPKVDAFMSRESKWREEFEQLRRMMLTLELTEELKWGVPCYTVNGKNVVLIHGFKEYCGIFFVKGALLKDDEGVLIQQTENVQAARQIRFTKVEQVISLESTIKRYVQEAIENEKAGLAVVLKEVQDIPVPEEFKQVLDQNPELKTAFAALTPGRQKAYNRYFTEPKQVKTRLARIEKYTNSILNGKGLND
ncbi:uncharacterized protein YdeI (YjbR/CyaY-like superfamily) [Paenibacillus turicensis]|uniref:Uncharacterized protein YdeI (YjbR/CyaY-like superfamily) n=1 Tax=Paenibacillus turicensis TaxID=160487 RepID=A0ABS4FMD5_9BACL|nr:DUF1801 domain-containing protein [Paenibacillus turicensis]MBP1903746.1 uncharacterized protein YdeI (YjbR/CyaY-like superfamily) [Paenibacillus turicensis]